MQYLTRLLIHGWVNSETNLAQNKAPIQNGTKGQQLLPVVLNPPVIVFICTQAVVVLYST